ncbi:MAG: HlyD family efflux transporter periplasmic adaptor subunit [Gemmatimonadetes bacterium]|nr:HlyD family efflux transporter periplasmic adaptor subunit [Gemmatimonadota bacterium]
MKPKRIIPAIIVLVVVVTAGWLLFGRGNGEDANAITASGTVEVTEADLGFQLGGRIAAIDVHEGDAVRAGQVLARLDAAELDARRSAAEAQVAAARALLLELQRGARPEELEQAIAAESAARRRLEEVAASAERTRALEQGGAASKEQLDQAETGLALARAQHEQAAQQLRMVREGPRAERVSAQEAVVRQARGALAQVDAQLANAVIHAPFAGVVSVRHREPGETVGAGMPVLTVQDPKDRWVRIYVREDEVGRSALNQPARITADAYPGRAYPGHVSFISSEAEFTPRNVQTAEERVKLVYAVKVNITDDPRSELKPGLPADVQLLPRTAARQP